MRTASQDIAPVMSFDGVNDVIEVAHASNLMITTGSWGAWAFFPRKTTSVGYPTLMNKCSTSGWTDGFGMSIPIAGSTDPQNASLRFYINYASKYVDVSLGAFLGSWHHYAATYDGAVLRAYVDGELMGSFVSSGTITSNTQKLFIGGGQSIVIDTASYHFPGRIADAFVSSTAFTGEQIKRLMGRDSTMVALCASFWKLNDGPSATSAADSVGSNTGTISGATNTVYGPSYSRTRVRNVPYSLYINGSSGSRIVLDAAATTNYGTGDFSFGCFINPSRPGATAAANTIFASYYADVDGQRGMLFRYNASNQLVLAFGASSADITTTDTVSFGQWQHVGFVRSGDTATVYLNGLPTAKVTGMSARNVTSNVQGRLGEEPTGSNYNMNGFMTQPAFFGRALSAAEMLTWARQGIDAISQTSITLRDDFIDAPSTSITDNSGNGHTSTAQSTTWSRVSPTFLRPSLLENPVFNGDLVLYPSFTAATTTAGRWIDGTAAGSTTNDFWNWAIPALGVTAPGSAQFDSSVSNPNSVFGSSRALKLSTNSSAGAISVCNSLSASAPAASRYLTPLLPSTAYVITAKVKTSNVATNGAFIDLREFTGALASVTTTSSNKLSGTNDWTTVTLTVTTGATTRFGVIMLRNNVAGNVSDAWFTDIICRPT